MEAPIKHEGRAHALLGASSASRWLTCTPSARLEESLNLPEESSVFAEEGTFAHELSELEIRYSLDFIGLEDYVSAKNAARLSAHYSEEMVEETDKYVAFVLDAWKEAKGLDPFAEILIEDKQDLTPWIEEGFGTNDVVIISLKTLTVIDLKFGKGLKVSAKDNPQLMLYALGALDKHGFAYDIEDVRLVIHQPRLGGVSEFTLKALALEAWGDKFVKPRAALAFEGAGEFKPGEHCRFCKASSVCRALAEENLALAKFDFEAPALLEEAELAEIFDKAAVFVKWINSVTDYVQKQALAGNVLPGYKLVEGRANRVITDELAVKSKLRGEGFKIDEILNTKLKGLGDLEKLLGKVDFEKLVGPFVIKPAGKPTLVTADDPRPAYNSIEELKKDFEDE
jgi:hypothetical protein